MRAVVTFINERGRLVSKEFDSVYRCRLFVQKAMKSKRITLVSYPNRIFD